MDLVDEPLKCRLLPIVEQVLDFAKIRVCLRVRTGSDSDESIILQSIM
jgi:hypothetical protein